MIIKNERIISAKLMIENASKETNYIPAHRNRAMKLGFHFLSKALGKPNMRYWTDNAINQFNSNVEKEQPSRNLQKLFQNIQFEHVVPVAILSKRILDGESVNSITDTDNLFICLVTKNEHDEKLLKHTEKVGWDRYIEKGIQVFDTIDNKWIFESEPTMSMNESVIKMQTNLQVLNE